MNASITIIGSGPVGMRVAEEISARDQHRLISIYGNEDYAPYNRILLTSLLAGRDNRSSILLSPKIDNPARFKTYFNCAVLTINPDDKTIVCADGQIRRYEKLILATGALPYIPAIPNIALRGVSTLRTVADVEHLLKITGDSRVAVILGGGVLGIEIAAALHGLGLHVVILTHARCLMNRQLDETAAALLQAKLSNQGIEIVVDDGIDAVIGHQHVEAVRLKSGRIIHCDTLVLAVGVQANVELAKQAGIRVNRGIVVNDGLETSSKNIYALGDCAEFNGTVTGLVAPGFEQARVLATNLCGGRVRYSNGVAVTRIKLLDYPVCSLGEIDDSRCSNPNQPICYFQPDDRSTYRRLFFRDGRLLGCVALGDWHEAQLVQTVLAKKRRLWPWQIRRFMKTGRLLDGSDRVVDWASETLVCRCANVSKGQLDQAIRHGCRTVDSLTAATGATSNCGSCKPLLVELLGTDREPSKVFGAVFLLAALTVFMLGVELMAPRIPFQSSLNADGSWDRLWRDALLRQMTGYGLLTLSFVALSLSMRKRLAWTWGDFDAWRRLHLCAGLLALTGLALHTGLRLGEHLNRYLTLCFILAVLFGGAAGLVIALQHKMPNGWGRKLRWVTVWLHIVTLWPLLPLLGFHILQTYYF